jgi:hypothetical protein
MSCDAGSHPRIAGSCRGYVEHLTRAFQRQSFGVCAFTTARSTEYQDDIFIHYSLIMEYGQD